MTHRDASGLITSLLGRLGCEAQGLPWEHEGLRIQADLPGRAPGQSVWVPEPFSLPLAHRRLKTPGWLDARGRVRWAGRFKPSAVVGEEEGEDGTQEADVCAGLGACAGSGVPAAGAATQGVPEPQLEQGEPHAPAVPKPDRRADGARDAACGGSITP